MNPFPIGQRVELIACPKFPGTVTGFPHGKVQVLFDDFRNDPPKPFKPECLQFAESRSVAGSVPKTVGSGTRFGIVGLLEESSSWRKYGTELFGTDEVLSLSTARVRWQEASTATTERLTRNFCG